MGGRRRGAGYCEWADGEWDHAAGGELEDHEVDGWYSQAGWAGVPAGWLVEWTGLVLYTVRAGRKKSLKVPHSVKPLQQ